MKKRFIAINLCALPDQQTGVGVFMSRFTAAIIKNLPHAEFLIFLKKGSEVPISLESNATLSAIAPRKTTRRLFWEQFVFPFHLRTKRVGILINLHYTVVLLAPSSIKQVTVYYDSTYQRHPWRRKLPQAVYYNLFTFLSVMKARHIFTLSNYIRHEIHQLYPFLKPEKVHVISPGTSSRCPIKGTNGNLLMKEYRNVSKLKPRKYIISISTVEPSKNYLRCITAFGQFLRQFPDFHYVIVGKRGWGDRQGREYRKIVSHINGIGLQSRVLLMGFLKNHQMQSLLCQASCLLYASLHEGFGIPLLDAMENKVPIITSNVSSMPEVVGSAAILVNPYSESSIAEGLTRLCRDPAEVERLVRRGQERLKFFSWDRGVKQFLTVMKRENLI